MSRTFRFVVLLGLLFSAGCASLEPLLAALTPSPVPTPRPTSTPPATATATIPPVPESPVLRVWLPPQFHPSTGNDAATLLGERFTEFESEHPGLTLEIRAKKSDEENNIVNTLAVTNTAAPDALPDLILLSRPDLEAAAMRGLLHPIDGLTTSLEDPNWYAYAQQLAHLQNTGYGLPLAGDAQVLIYYPELGTIVTWEDVLNSDGQLVFPAGNLDGLAGLSLYASAGGEILDAQGLPMLEEETLTRVLTLVEDAVAKEVFPSSLVNVTTEAQTLQIYRSGSANKGIIWILNYRPLEDGAITPLPGLEETPFSYATGWVWALAGSRPENLELAVELAEFLVEDPFIGEWTSATGYLPARPSSVETNDRTMNAILESAHPIPSNNVLTILGPLMHEALTRVLSGEEPATVAGSVVEKLR
ncbi:MAG TPA: extracellular solute-binding protein [Anaerolineales bacterium]|nr:extracellular solute-binding protein [Anaerolineales bacterium]